MTQVLESVLSRLLMPDNAVIQQATEELKKLFQDPEIVSSLCVLLTSSSNPQIRQYAAVLLRRKLSKVKQWNKLDEDQQARLKHTLLNIVPKETDKSAITACLQLIATLAKHELGNGKWPELLNALNLCIRSNSSLEKQFGLLMLSTISTTAGEHLKPHFKSLFSLFNNTLRDKTNKFIPLYTIQTMTNIATYIGTDEMNKFQALIPLVLNVVRDLTESDEDSACEAMEIFDELIECEVAIIAPHVVSLANVCLEIASQKTLGDNIRVKALAIIRWLIKMKRKSIIKHKLIEHILNSSFNIMCEPQENELDEDDECSHQMPSTFAAQVIDAMALHLPPEKVILPLLKCAEPALSVSDPYKKKAAFLSIAMSAEGCSEYIKAEYLESFLKVVCNGITDENSMVRNAALFALGQFSEYLQPDISKYATELLPVLFEYLSQTCQALQQGEQDPPNLTRSFYAIETFCENLEAELLPYLPTLMERLLTFLSTTQSAHAHELVVSAIGATANAVKEAMIPYFPNTLDHLMAYINDVQIGPATPLQIQTIDTLGILIRTVGPSNSHSLAHDCIRFALNMIDRVHDPDLRRSIYSLFASISNVLKADMATYLSAIMEHMVDSLVSTEGVVPHYSENNTENFAFFDDVDNEDEESIGEEEEEEEADDDITGFSIENAYLEEKEDACSCLGEIAENTGIAFLPYFEKCFEEVKKLTGHPGMEVRKSAITTLGQLCISLQKLAVETGQAEHHSAFNSVLLTLMPLLLSSVKEETERTVVLSTLETLNDVLKKVGSTVLLGETLLTVISLVKDAFRQKLACQVGAEEDDDTDIDQVAEYDSMLIELAGDLIPTIAQSMPSQEFAPYFAGLLPLLLAKTSKSCSASDKSFAIGTLAEVVEGVGKGGLVPFIPKLMNAFLQGMKDSDEEVRSNAVYGIGVLAENSGENMLSHYSIILQALSEMLAVETDSRAKDNICGCVARLIMSNREAVPLKQVFPVLLKCLPLKKDFEENVTVYKCIYQLYTAHCEEVFQNLAQILRVISLVLPTQQITDEIRLQLVTLVNAVRKEFPNDFNSVLQMLPSEHADVLMTLPAVQ